MLKAMTICVLCATLFAATGRVSASSQGVSVDWNIGGGPGCDLPGDPDVCYRLTYEADGTPSGYSWLSISRYNLAATWSTDYEVWLLNNSARFVLTNVKAIGIDVSEETGFDRLAKVSADGGPDVRVFIGSDVHSVIFSLTRSPPIASVKVDGAPVSFNAGSNLEVTLSLSAVLMTIDFQGRGSVGGDGGFFESVAAILPYLLNPFVLIGAVTIVAVVLVVRRIRVGEE